MWDVMDEELIGKCGRSQGMPKLFLWPISEPVWSTLQWSGRANMFYMFKKLFQTRETLTSWSCRIKWIVQLFRLVQLLDPNKWKKFSESIKIWFVLGKNTAFFPLMHNHKCIHETKESYVGKQSDPGKSWAVRCLPSYFKSKKASCTFSGTQVLWFWLTHIQLLLISSSDILTSSNNLCINMQICVAARVLILVQIPSWAQAQVTILHCYLSTVLGALLWSQWKE